MLDLVVTGGTAVLPSGAQAADIGVVGGKIAAIGAPGSLQPAGAARIVDASDQIVMPGGVDPHIHCSMPIPFPGRNEDLLSAPPEQVSRAALHGGTTTLLDFAQCPPDQPLQQSIELRQREWAGACYCDYGFHLLLHGKPSQGVLAALPEAIQDGHASVKMFTTDIRPNRQGRMVQFGDIWEVLQILAAKGGIAAIHAEDNDIVMHMYEKLIREDRVGFENMAEVHNTLSEDLSFNRVIRLAENVEGAALYMVHVSAATGAAAIARSRAQGFPIYGETLHQYLLYTAEDYKRAGGQMYHTYPSLKFAKDQEALWAATGHGAIQAIATDEVCCPLQVKLQGRRIDDTTGGNSGVEPRLSLMYTHMVVQPCRFCRARLVECGAHHGALSAKGSVGGRLGCRHRAPRPTRPEGVAQGGSARDRLHAVGRPRSRRLAEHDDPARQNRGRQRRVPCEPERRSVSTTQDRRRHSRTPGALTA
jgi:dihydropyrimidinase